MDPETNGPGRDSERFRPYLTYLARKQLDRRLRAKVDLSGVVNQTLYEAQRDAERIQGASESEWRAWLRRILANKLVHAARFRMEAEAAGQLHHPGIVAPSNTFVVHAAALPGASCGWAPW